MTMFRPDTRERLATLADATGSPDVAAAIRTAPPADHAATRRTVPLRQNPDHAADPRPIDYWIGRSEARTQERARVLTLIYDEIEWITGDPADKAGERAALNVLDRLAHAVTYPRNDGVRPAAPPTDDDGDPYGDLTGYAPTIDTRPARRRLFRRRR